MFYRLKLYLFQVPPRLLFYTHLGHPMRYSDQVKNKQYSYVKQRNSYPAGVCAIMYTLYGVSTGAFDLGPSIKSPRRNMIVLS